MTLIVAQPAKDGMIIGSDSQVTSGPIRTKSVKVHELNKFALWGASGELALIQRVAERIEAFPERDNPLSAIRDTLANFVKESLEILLKVDFRTGFAAGDAERLMNLHPGDFLFVEYRDGRCQTLHVMTNGIAEWVDGRACTGSGDVFAHALLTKYEDMVMDRQHAKLLVHKVIEEAVRVGAWGLCEPIDIWEISEDGARQVSSEERYALADAAELVRSTEIEILMKHSPQVSTDATENTAKPITASDASEDKAS